MIDLINGIIQCSQFKMDANKTITDFSKKYPPNYIKLNTYHYNTPEINIGDFIADKTLVSFKNNGIVDIVSLHFVSDNKNLTLDPGMLDLLSPLKNNITSTITDKYMMWQMPYGTIILSWDCWPQKNEFILELRYKHWQFDFQMSNSFSDVVFGLIKTHALDNFCLTQIRHSLINELESTDKCKLYATNSKCDDCDNKCTLNKIWNIYNQPSYKELVNSIPEREYSNENELIIHKHANLTGIYQTLDFEFRRSDKVYELVAEGYSEHSYADIIQLLTIIDNFANILSEWYMNFKMLN